MTNEQIIMSNRVFLMEEGLIGGTGETFLFKDEDGNEREVEVPEEIHTYKAWKKLGFFVKKGEHSVARFPIWQKSSKKAKGDEDEEGEPDKSGKYYKKVAFFFTRAQVEEIVKPEQ